MELKIIPFTRLSLLILIIGLSYGVFGQANAQMGSPVNTTLAQGGSSAQDVVVGPNASNRSIYAAESLAEHLGRITGGNFQVRTGDGTSGIAVGSFDEFPALNLEILFKPDNPTRQDEFLMHSHGSGVYLVGASDYGALNGVWTLLQHIGFRQFFPTPQWEYIPDLPDLTVEVSSFEQPSFFNRNAPRPTSWTDDNAWGEWRERNRFNNSFNIRTGHVYASIIRRNQEEFDAHPEYLSGNKFVISNEGLRKLVVEDAKRMIEENPGLTSISMDPSDGGGWSTSEEELAMGSISDRVVILANEVAEAINDMGYGEKFVGIYAYNQHSPPPNVDVHPNVIVSIATSYVRGGYSVDQMIDGWGERGAILGIRGYFDTFTNSQGLPRHGVGGNVNYIKSRIPSWHKNGVQLVRANTTDAWAVNGLGFYVAAQLQWDAEADAEEIVEDFLVKAFGDAYEPMKAFYELVGRGTDRPRTNSDLLNHMYGYLNDAYQLTEDQNVIDRLNDLTLYTRYVELMYKFGGQAEAQATYRHAYRMQSVMMSPVNQLYRYFRRSRVDATVPSEIHPQNSYDVGMELEYFEGWWDDTPFTQEEILGFVEKGLAQNEIDDLEFELLQFDNETLVPARDWVDFPEVRTGRIGDYNASRGSNRAFTWLEEEQPLELLVRGGSIYQDRGNIRMYLSSPLEATLEAVDEDESTPPDNETHEVILKSPYSGLHTLEWSDGGDRTHLIWDEGQPMTLYVGADRPYTFQRGYDLWFFVPEGTEIVGGYMDRQEDADIYDADGNKIEGWRDGYRGYFNIPVPPDNDGRLWRVTSDKRSQLVLMSVPPYLARNGSELLLPLSVFVEEEEKDTTSTIPTSADFEDVPDTYELHQNYPNPFNPSTHIRFGVPEQAHVRLDVYNVIGQRVTTLVNEVKNPGRYQQYFDASNLSSGIYIYRLQTNSHVDTRQMMLIK